MFKMLIPTAALLAGATVALAQNAPPAGGAPGAQGGPGGGRPMMDPAARFKELDANNDGKLSLAEFEAMRPGQRMGGGAGGAPGGAPPAGAPPAGAGAGGMMASAADRFKAADTNNNGSLSVEEFTAMMQNMRGRMGGGGGGN